MRLRTAAAALITSASVSAVPTSSSAVKDVPARYKQGFTTPIVSTSAGGKAICVSGMVPITASAQNYDIGISAPRNQYDLTEFIVEVMQVNSTVPKSDVKGLKTVSGTFDIFAQLCFPTNKAGDSIAPQNASSALHFTVHGAGFDHRYWDALPGYSYVDVAAAQGYTTFLYDRLGYGKSSHPDGLSVTQLPLGTEVSHQLVHKLRQGFFSATKFDQVVGVGHSFGSLTLNGLTTKYPADLDAAVLTGYSPDNSGVPVAFASVDLTIALQTNPAHYSKLVGNDTAYLTGGSIRGTQSFFFRAPGAGFDPAVLRFADSIKDTISLGEFFSVGASAPSPKFIGPVAVVNGMYDLPNCHGNCLVPENKMVAGLDEFFPNAAKVGVYSGSSTTTSGVGKGSAWFAAANSGHGINMHYSAGKAYQFIVDWIKVNGF